MRLVSQLVIPLMRGVDPRESLKGFKICLLAFLVNLDRWCVKKATVIFLVVVMSDLELVSYRGLPGHRLSMDPVSVLPSASHLQLEDARRRHQ